MSRLAVVTGGTRGIGAAISEGLKKAGYDVAAIYANDKNNAESFAEKSGASVYKCNVSSFEDCQKVIEEISSDFNKAPEILVNNAGVTKDSMLHKMPQEDWHSVTETNLGSCFNMCRAIISGMRSNNFGRIVNISSINALAGQVGQTNYAASKAGMLGFTKSLARESAYKGITVNAVAPGYIKTDMTGKVSEKVMDKIISQIPAGRLGNPEEIARTVLFLVDDNAGFITGETISVNGGHHME